MFDRRRGVGELDWRQRATIERGKKRFDLLHRGSVVFLMGLFEEAELAYAAVQNDRDETNMLRDASGVLSLGTLRDQDRAKCKIELSARSWPIMHGSLTRCRSRCGMARNHR